MMYFGFLFHYIVNRIIAKRFVLQENLHSLNLLRDTNERVDKHFDICRFIANVVLKMKNKLETDI